MDDAARNHTAKGLDDYRQEKPGQLALFEHLLPTGNPYSNTIDLYDFIPKYNWSRPERISGRFLETLTREFECRGKRYKVEIHPARLKDKNGVEKEFYPGIREELIEDALRKFVCEGQGVFLDDQAGVKFTLYQLQQELQSHGHTYNTTEIKDALLTCGQVKMVLTDDEGKQVIVSSLFQTVGLQTREDWKGKGKKTRAYVRFNPLVTQCINTLSFRQVNYSRSMSLKSVIARQLHKRMSHHYTQASWQHPYTISLSTLIRDFGLTTYKELRNNLRDVIFALDELKAANLVITYSVEKTTDPRRRNRLVDAKFTLTPDMSFSGEIIQANQRRQEITRQASLLKLTA